MKSIIRQAKTIDEAVEEALAILGIDRSKAKVDVLEEPESGFLGLFGAKDAVVRVSYEAEDEVAGLINEVFYDEDKEPELVKKEAESFEETEELEPKIEPIVEDEFEEEDLAEGDSSVEAEDLIVEDEEVLEETEEETLEFSEDSSVETAGLFEGSEEEPGEKMDFDHGYELPRSYYILEKILKTMDTEGNIDYSLDGNDIHYKIVDTAQRDTSIIIGKRGETLDAIQYILNLCENRHSKDYIRVTLDISNYRDRRKASLERLARNMAKKVQREKRPIRLEPMNAYERKIVHSALQNVKGVSTHSEDRDPRRRVVIDLEDEE